MKALLFFILLLVNAIGNSQEITVTGKVTDQRGEILPGASVLVKGTNRAAQTDMDGAFSIKGKKGEILEFTYVGMKRATATITDESKLAICMNDGEMIICEVGPMPIRRPKKELMTAVTAVPENELLAGKRENTVGTPDTLRVAPEKLNFGDELFQPGIFEKDLRENKLHIYAASGFAGPRNPEQNKAFEKKYGITYHDFGCLVPSENKKHIAYNHKVFALLKKKYGNDWEKTIRKDAMGWETWKKSKK